MNKHKLENNQCLILTINMNESHIHAEHIDEAYQLFQDGILAFAEMEQQGMRVDVDYIERKNKQIDRKILKLETVIYDSDFFREWQMFAKKKVNIYSPVQIENYLYKHLNLKVAKQTKSGKGSTDEETLGKLNIPELDTLLEIKKLKKIQSTYLAGFLREQVNGVIHPNFNLHFVVSFRSSVDSPNLQNIPKRDKESMKICRQALYPRVGYQLMEFDFSQLEVRTSCAYHKDPTMIKYIETDHDFHKDLAMQIFNLKEYDPAIHKELRQAAKNGFVFAEFYGDYYKNCVKNIATNWCKLSEGGWKKGQGIMVGKEHVSDLFIRSGITSYKKLEKHLEEIENDLWGNRFPVYDKWRNDHWKEYQKNGYLISKTGFLYTGIMSRNDVYNYENQGSAFHVMLWCLIQATKKFKELKLKTRIVNQIHDSILLDAFPPEREQVTALMKRIMERDVRKHWDWINVPLKVNYSLSGVDCSWAESKED